MEGVGKRVTEARDKGMVIHFLLLSHFLSLPVNFLLKPGASSFPPPASGSNMRFVCSSRLKEDSSFRSVEMSGFVKTYCVRCADDDGNVRAAKRRQKLQNLIMQEVIFLIVHDWYCLSFLGHKSCDDDDTDW